MKTVMTGGSGLLGMAIQKLRPDWMYPPHSAIDITNFNALYQFCLASQAEILVHAAALTGIPRCEKEQEKAAAYNIFGTAIVTAVCRSLGMRLIYISTDYVYASDQEGAKSETDPLLPISKYAWSKLGGECAVRMYDNSVIIRTVFGPDQFQFDIAYYDQWTSKESVSEIAPKIVNVVESDFRGVINIGGPRRTIYDYAHANNPDGREIKSISRKQSEIPRPFDTSLDTSIFYNLFGGK